MEKKRYIKLFIIMIVAIIILIFDIAHSILQEVDYEKRKDSGNDRWLQVENRILQTEEKTNTIEEKVNTIEEKLQ